MPDPVVAAPAVPVTPAPAAPAPAAVAPVVAATPPATPASPAAASATPEKPAAAAPPVAEPEAPPSLIPDPDAKPAAAAIVGAPEKYEFKLPDGVTLNADAQARYETFAREENLSQDAAQKYLDRHIAEITTQKAADRQAWFNTQKEWQAEITADKTIGGANLPTSKQAIGRLVNHLGPELGKSFREALDFTGAGNNPAVFRSLVKLAERFTEGTPVKGNPGAPSKSAASVLYPSHAKG